MSNTSNVCVSPLDVTRHDVSGKHQMEESETPDAFQKESQTSSGHNMEKTDPTSVNYTQCANRKYSLVNFSTPPPVVWDPSAHTPHHKPKRISPTIKLFFIPRPLLEFWPLMINIIKQCVFLPWILYLNITLWIFVVKAVSISFFGGHLGAKFPAEQQQEMCGLQNQNNELKGTKMLCQTEGNGRVGWQFSVWPACFTWDVVIWAIVDKKYWLVQL